MITGFSRSVMCLGRSRFHALLRDYPASGSHGNPTPFIKLMWQVTLDSSVIDLCLSLFDWTKFRQTKGAVKLHLLLDHDGYLPSFLLITDGKRHDVRVAQKLHLQPGSIVAMDRGYNDYKLRAMDR